MIINQVYNVSLKNLVNLPKEDIKDIIIEKSDNIKGKEFIGMNSLERIYIKDTREEIKLSNLQSLRHIRFDGWETNSMIRMRNLPSLTSIEFKFSPNWIHHDFVVNCPKLNIQSLLNDKTHIIDSEAFKNIKEDTIILPDSIHSIYTDSFTRENNKPLKIISNNVDLMIILRKEEAKNNNIFVVPKGTTIAHLPKHKVRLVENSNSINPDSKKLAKLKLLGMDNKQYSIAKTKNEILSFLLIVDNNLFKEKITKHVKCVLENDFSEHGYMSNGFNSLKIVLYDLIDIAYTHSNRTDVKELDRLILICHKNRSVMCFTDKNIILDIFNENYKEYSNEILDGIKMDKEIPYGYEDISEIKEYKDHIDIKLKNGGVKSIYYY